MYLLVYTCRIVDTEKNVDMEDLVDEFFMFYLAGMVCNCYNNDETFVHLQDKSQLPHCSYLLPVLLFRILTFIGGVWKALFVFASMK